MIISAVGIAVLLFIFSGLLLLAAAYVNRIITTELTIIIVCAITIFVVFIFVIRPAQFSYETNKYICEEIGTTTVCMYNAK